MGYTVTVMGLGFVGLTTALAFAEKNHKVYGFDVDKERMEMIEEGRLPFVEPGLDDALLRHNNKNFTVVHELSRAIESSDFIFLCVGTPCDEKGEADLKYIFSAIDMVEGELMDDKFRVIVIKSTVPPSTTEERIIPYIKKKNIGVANNPEFLREGHCWEDMIYADRIVCGVSDERSEVMLRELYEGFEAPLYAVSYNTGEFIKYLSNTLLATMISYSNEMSKIADAIGNIQVRDAFKILHLDKRWNACNMTSYVYPGCGYGGYCLPKDTQAMYANAVNKGYTPKILEQVIEVNESMPKFVADKITKITSKEETIGILGLSFKPESDDVRDSSSAKIIKCLLNEGYTNILVYDPIANKAFQRLYNIQEVEYCESKEDLCTRADTIVLATAWKEFKDINLSYPQKKIVDSRYFLGRE